MGPAINRANQRDFVVMTPDELKRWRIALGLSQKDAAHALGLKRRVIQYYEKGERDGEDIEIPLTVRLACYAVAQGVTDYHGPVPDLANSAAPEADKPEKERKAKDKDKDKKRKGKGHDLAKNTPKTIAETAEPTPAATPTGPEQTQLDAAATPALAQDEAPKLPPATAADA